MGNKNDGQRDKNSSAIPEHIKTYGEDGLAHHGNADANKLATAFKKLSKDGLSDVELQKLQKLDDDLKGADFHCLSKDVTLVTQHENGLETNFVIASDRVKQNSEFANSKNKPSKML